MINMVLRMIESKSGYRQYSKPLVCYSNQCLWSGSVSQRAGIRSIPSLHKNTKEMISTLFYFFMTFYLGKKLFFVGVLKVTDEKSRLRIPKCHGSTRLNGTVARMLSTCSMFMPHLVEPQPAAGSVQNPSCPPVRPPAVVSPHTPHSPPQNWAVKNMNIRH